MGERATLDPGALDESAQDDDVAATGEALPVAAPPSPIQITVCVDPASPAGLRGKTVLQTVDPTISRAKFERQVGAFRRHEAAYRSRGWILQSAEFPKVALLLAVPQLRPMALLFAVVIDFTNYDVEPPSVRLVDPLSGRALRFNELAINLARRAIRTPNAEATPAEVGARVIVVPEFVTLLQAAAIDAPPFLCIPGVLEYHNHPGHTGDSWLLHRHTGAGTLDAILSVFETYGVLPIRGYQIALRQVGDRIELVVSNSAGLFIPDIPA